MEPSTLSSFERLSLINQFKILSFLDESNQQDYEYLQGILSSGYTGLYDKIFEWISDEKPKELVEETTSVLNMYRSLRNSIGQLSQEDQSELNLESIDWEGFDNHEDHYHVMSLMHSSGLWAELNDLPRDSHSSTSIIKYRQMLKVFNQFERSDFPLNRNQIEELIDSVNS